MLKFNKNTPLFASPSQNRHSKSEREKDRGRESSTRRKLQCFARLPQSNAPKVSRCASKLRVRALCLPQRERSFTSSMLRNVILLFSLVFFSLKANTTKLQQLLTPLYRVHQLRGWRASKFFARAHVRSFFEQKLSLLHVQFNANNLHCFAQILTVQKKESACCARTRNRFVPKICAILITWKTKILT